jgi:hypothetical protein
MTVATNFVSVGGRQGKLEPPQAPGHSSKSLYAMLSLGGAGIFGLVWPAGRGRNQRRRWLRLAIAGAVLLVAVLALQGCGGIKERTPAGTYTVTVNASSVNTIPAQTATASVSLVVN